MHSQTHKTLPHKPLEQMEFAELDALREELGLPQSRVCRCGDINPTSYTRWRRWVRGDHDGSKPHPRSLRAVRDVLLAEMDLRKARLAPPPHSITAP